MSTDYSSSWSTQLLIGKLLTILEAKKSEQFLILGSAESLGFCQPRSFASVSYCARRIVQQFDQNLRAIQPERQGEKCRVESTEPGNSADPPSAPDDATRHGITCFRPAMIETPNVYIYPMT